MACRDQSYCRCQLAQHMVREQVQAADIAAAWSPDRHSSRLILQGPEGSLACYFVSSGGTGMLTLTGPAAAPRDRVLLGAKTSVFAELLSNQRSFAGTARGLNSRALLRDGATPMHDDRSPAWPAAADCARSQIRAVA